MKFTGKANPRAGVKVLDAAGKDVPVFLDGSVPVDELQMIDSKGRLAYVHILGGEDGDGSGGADKGKRDAPHKPRR